MSEYNNEQHDSNTILTTNQTASAYDDLDEDFEIEELDEETESAEAQEEDAQTTSSLSKSVIMHIVLLTLIVILASVSIWKLYQWNKGTPSEYDPNAVDTESNIEAEDSGSASSALP